MTSAALRLRRKYADLFQSGGYRPLPADGPAAAHVVSYCRGADVVVDHPLELRKVLDNALCSC